MFPRLCGSVLFLLVLIGCSSTVQRQNPPASALVSIEQLVANFERLETRGFAGQLVVVRANDVVVRRGFGTLESAGSHAVDANAVMPLASVTKPITASAVLALAADARLSLDDPIGNHLPGLAQHWSSVPIRHFLVHTAGLPPEIVNRAWDGVPRFEPVGRDQLIRRVNRFRPDRPPGTRFVYSNVGYNLLAALIEAVSGQPFERFVADRLLGPAGIAGIGLLGREWTDRDLVSSRGGSSQSGHFFDQPMLDDGAGFHLRGAGDLMATPDGVIAWWLAVRRKEWLPRPWLTKWLQARVTEPDGSRYGYGWNFRDSPFGPVVGHTGQVLGFTVDLSWYPEQDLFVYINSADVHFPADNLRIDNRTPRPMGARNAMKR